MNMLVNSEMSAEGRKVFLIFTEVNNYEKGLHKIVYDHLINCVYAAKYNEMEDDGVYVEADSFKQAILIVKIVDELTKKEMKKRLNDIYGFNSVSRETSNKEKWEGYTE